MTFRVCRLLGDNFFTILLNILLVLCSMVAMTLIFSKAWIWILVFTCCARDDVASSTYLFSLFWRCYFCWCVRWSFVRPLTWEDCDRTYIGLSNRRINVRIGAPERINILWFLWFGCSAYHDSTNMVAECPFLSSANFTMFTFCFWLLVSASFGQGGGVSWRSDSALWSFSIGRRFNQTCGLLHGKLDIWIYAVQMFQEHK